MHFADTLFLCVRSLGHPLCVGLDPQPGRIPPLFRPREGWQPGSAASADAVEAFCDAVLERVAGRVAIVKPQIAFFEQLGWRGMRALARIVARARRAGLLVLLDAKRGDIGSTAEGYAAAYLAPGAPFEVDAITLNPYMGLDALEPFLRAAAAHGRGLFVLVKTSNPGSADVQDLEAGVVPLYERVAALLEPLAQRLVGEQTGWSSLGAVVGATHPAQLESVRKLLPRSPQLVPGYGAQGASAQDAVRGFVPAPDGAAVVREGGIVNASRSILYPPGAEDAKDASAWQRAIDRALEQAIGELRAAVAR